MLLFPSACNIEDANLVSIVGYEILERVGGSLSKFLTGTAVDEIMKVAGRRSR